VRREKSGGGEGRRLGYEQSGDFYAFTFGLCWNDVLRSEEVLEMVL
jgi:hypothetical protein